MLSLRSSILLCLLISFGFTTACGIFVPSDDYVRGERPARVSNKGAVDATSTLRTQVIKDASSLKGTRYKYGGTNPKTGMDCSGLTNYVFLNAGISLNRSSKEQAKNGNAIKLKDAKAGDLVFFKNGGRIFHVALITEYTGDKLWVVHSTTSRGVISEEILSNSYWKPKIAFVRDVISR